jgi:hypothetical protein
MPAVLRHRHEAARRHRARLPASENRSLLPIIDRANAENRKHVAHFDSACWVVIENGTT